MANRKPPPPPPESDDPSEGGLSSPPRTGGLENPPSISDPETPLEWQEAVDCAHFYLLVESARAYGLISGGPEVNLARCEEILKRARGLGYRPKELR